MPKGRRKPFRWTSTPNWLGIVREDLETARLRERRVPRYRDEYGNLTT